MASTISPSNTGKRTVAGANATSRNGVTPGAAPQTSSQTGRRKLMGVRIASTGSYAPPEIVRNEDLAVLGYDADWIIQRTGIRARRRAPEGMNTSDMAHESAIRCLEAAGLNASDVDMIIVATMTPDTPMPSTACHLASKLGATAPAFDVNAACSGFMFGLITGMQFVKTGCSQNVLVVGADLMSRVLNPADKITFPLFGDGSGAVLLQPAAAGEEDSCGILAYNLGADGDGANLLVTPAGGTREPLSEAVLRENRQFLQMEGRAVFKWAVRKVSECIARTISEARMTADEIDLLVLHQANVRIIDAAVEAVGIDRSKVHVNLDRYGNTSAGSIPLVLDEAYREGRINRGDHILTCGFGAGLTWGAAVMRW